MSTVSITRLKAIAEMMNKIGEEPARIALGLSQETLNRYKRKMVDENIVIVPNVTLLQQIAEKFTPEELKLLAKKSALVNKTIETKEYNFSGETTRIGVISDTHIGSVYFDEDYLLSVMDYMASEGCEMILHSGDVVDGLSNRPIHIYELSHIGFDAQKKYAIDLLNSTTIPIKVISGNHDAYYKMSAGANIVQDIAEACDNVEYLGHDEADIMINTVKVRMWHGLDGNSYAYSYRIQKLVESWAGGEKPHILFAGHVHKSTFTMDRNVACFSSGCIQRQSKWMRGKRLAAHVGFWIVDITNDEKGLVSVAQRWTPRFE